MLLFDIETDGLLDDCTRVWCMVTYDTDTQEWNEFGPDSVDRGTDLLRGQRCVAAHNALGFDLPALRKLHGAGVLGEGTRVVDTLVLSRLAFPDLDGVAEVDSGTGERTYETHSVWAWGKRLKLPKLPQMEFTEYVPEMLTYCRRDVEIVKLLLEEIQAKAPWALTERCCQIEHDFAQNIEDMTNLGAPYDKAAADEMLLESAAKKADLIGSLIQLHPGWQDPKVKKVKIVPFNPTSRQQVARFLKEKHGWKPTAFTPSGQPEVSEDILEALPFPEAKMMAECFRLTKLCSSLDDSPSSWGQNYDPVTGRIHGVVIHNGTPTGRCRHSSPNLGNIPRKGEWLKCRSLFAAKEGKLLVGADASRLELVMLAHYLSFWDGGEYAKIIESGDVHAYNQKAAGLATRDAAKTLIYALIYGAGDVKLGSIVSASKNEKELAQAGRQTRKKFLSNIPAYAALSASVKNKAKTNGYLVGLDGRRIPIRSEHAALNFLLQGGGAVVMKLATNKAISLFEPETARLVLHVHDEMQMEAVAEKADMVGRLMAASITSAALELGVRCHLDAAYKVGKTWKDTH